MKQNESVTVPSHSFKSMRRDSEDSEFLQGNVAKVNKVSNVYAAANSVVSHAGHGFPLPVYRTIYDVNTDTFGGKRWGYQGANRSFLPNYGFNEDSWRQYCMTVPKGRAIEVEDSGGERFPTMNQKCPDNWDSDVVIEIKVQDFDENSNVFSKRDLSGKSSGDNVSKSCVKSADVVAEASHSGAASVDRVSLGSPEGTRSSQSLFETRESSQHPDNCERDHIPDSDEHHPRRTRVKTEELAEAIESERDSKDGSVRRSSKSDQHQSDSDSLIDDKSRFSLTLSCSESDSEPSADSCRGVSRCSSLGTELHDTVSSVHCKSNDSEQADSDQRRMADDSLLNGRRRCENKGGQSVKSEHDLDLPKRNDSSYFRSREYFSGDGGQRWGASYVETDHRKHPLKKCHKNLEGEAYTWDRGNQSARLRDRRINEMLQLKHRYNSLDEEYGSRSPFSGRGINACERGLGHSEKGRLNLDHLWHEEEEMDREYWKAHHQDKSNYNQDPSFRSGSYTSNQSRWQNGNISRRYNQYGSSVMSKYSRPREELYDSGTYGGCFGSEVKFDSGFDDQHQLAKTRYVWRSRIRQGEESKSSHRGFQSYPDRFSCYGEALGHENISGYGILRERHSENLIKSNLMYKCEREKMVMTCVNGPVGFVSQRVKLSGKQHATGKLMPKIKPKKKNQKYLNAPLSGKANRREQKPQTEGNDGRVATTFQGKGQKNESDIEEGEIVAGEPNTKKVKAPQCEKADSSNTVTNKAVYDEQWILERLAKMEKRRERFKVPVVVPEKVSTTDLNPPSCSQPQADSSVSTGETKLERPARKRRWAGI
ncbi:unnamed protein product [Linum trigynum]|uniref:Pre-mRNA polyadenylation factor Fip1 domain-containing protein n=1 Tax=Linum trigynum TaxID=586398 RepID=A0AAV2FI93_9ROSI